jgi:anaerobic selenocysteine-containing dehydrogenase
LFGPQHGLDWFEKNGVITWPRKAEEIYWKPFVGGRTFIYAEYLKEVADQVEKVTTENGLPRLDLTPFQPLPDWRPCRSHQEKRSEYDLFVVWRRDSLVAQRWTHQHPWLDEACEIDPYVYHVIINSDTAEKKGLKIGDWVDLTSATSKNSIKARARLSEGIHPEVVCIPGGGGHWAKGLPIASQRDKGALFEWLVRFGFGEDIDPVTLNVDWCVKVKVSKTDKERRT